ncbi:hypothetical protein SH580_12730 [Coraliomargarita algicola]|uniref:Discoidin domain-containing protein n=1 Tax=Coraliomargarita algicola TaxID=3092156 RepID=A0ABZ0RE74_9BACT|nr:hypothetical protein [Coraliomargarita sp. J2-16]WPJ94301.1 hypothetical protein SH580_12730 [Coraliomargarita sp. J2-16]
MRKHDLRQFRAMAALLITGAIAPTHCISHAQAPQRVASYQSLETSSKTRSKAPRNLTRWHMGARLILVQNGKFQPIDVSEVSQYDEAVFLSDNSALSYNISAGPHDYIVDLGKFVRVSRFFLNNQSAAGTFKVLVSDTLEDLKSDTWLQLSNDIAFEKGVIPSVTFPEIEIRYILLRFNIDSAGTIGNFGATGGTY